MALTSLATKVNKFDPEPVTTYIGYAISSANIREWLTKKTPSGMPKRLDTGYNEPLSILMLLYMKTATLPVYENKGDQQWIAVRYKDVKIALKMWKRRREALGKLEDAIAMAQKAKLFKVIIFRKQLYIQPTSKCVSVMTATGEDLAVL